MSMKDKFPSFHLQIIGKQGQIVNLTDFLVNLNIIELKARKQGWLKGITWRTRDNMEKIAAQCRTECRSSNTAAVFANITA